MLAIVYLVKIIGQMAMSLFGLPVNAWPIKTVLVRDMFFLLRLRLVLHWATQ